MPLANTSERYGGVAKVFHWLTALLILTLIPLGIVANWLPYDTSEQLARKALLFSLHKTLGVTVFFVALARIGWAFAQPKPGPMHPERRAEHWLAETVHWLLYGSLLLVPMSGWIHHAATTGFAPIWWPLGQNLPFVPKDDDIAAVFKGLHIVFERVLVISILLHVAGALKHHLLDKDGTLRRMWFGSSELPKIAPWKWTSLPLITALTLWCVAVGVGGMLGLYASHASAVVAPQDTVASDTSAVAANWEVAEGEIQITINQFGSDVTGSFTDWSAAISFDPDVPNGKAGEVEIRIATPSLQLGSVTEQALGADYFDVSTHPIAVYTADIYTAADGYIAQGTLTIKENSVPVDLPFSLTVQGDSAQMKSRASLRRLDFGIGANMTDESSLGFAVQVDVSVTATRLPPDPNR